jgi:protein TonB
MTEDKENRDKKIGLAVSLGVHALLALLFIFIMAWRAPNPPHPEYGVVLNFGVDEAGSGDVQPEAKPTEEVEQVEEVEESVPEESEAETVEEEVTEPVEEVTEESAVTTQESPVQVPEVKEEKRVEKPREEVKEPVKKPAEKQPEEKKPAERKVESAYPAKDAAVTESQGDKDETGDQGDPEGQLNERALYGNQGGGGGSSFSLEGWNWDWIPKPKDTSSENGRLVFEIKVNAEGEILSVRTLERSVSPAVEKIYRSEVEKLTFSRKSSSGTAPPVSTGTITFVITSK